MIKLFVNFANGSDLHHEVELMREEIFSKDLKLEDFERRLMSMRKDQTSLQTEIRALKISLDSERGEKLKLSADKKIQNDKLTELTNKMAMNEKH